MTTERSLSVIQPAEVQEIRAEVPETLHNNTNSVVIKQKVSFTGSGIIGHIGLAEVQRIMTAANTGKYGERNSLLIGLLFDSCLRISELLELTPERIDKYSNRIKAANLKRGKDANGKPKVEISWVGISESIKNQLIAFVWSNKIPDSQRIFSITRYRAHQILTAAMKAAGIVQPERTGRVHVLRHSGALALLAATGNIQLVRGQLRHSQINMSMNYLKTYARDEAVRAKGNIDLWK
jgi:integrase